MINIKVDKSNKYTACENSLYIKFDYDIKIVNVIRALPIRYWDADNKTWEVPVKYLPEIIKNLGDFDIEIAGEYICLDKKENAEKPSNFEFKTKPYEHQIVAFNFGLNNNRWLLGDEMGLGKTKTVIDIAVAKKAQHNYKHCLIICGVNGLKWNWKKEIEIHSNEAGYILGQRVKAGKLQIGSNADKLADVKNLANIKDYFIITNIETLRNTEILEKLIGFCKDGTIGVIAADEVHRCFDYNTLITTDKGKLKIGDIVTNKLNVKILSYNEITGKHQYKHIKNWFKNSVSSNLLELTLQTKNGLKTIKCTDTHKFYTKNRGWISAKDLTENDDIVEI